MTSNTNIHSPNNFTQEPFEFVTNNGSLVAPPSYSNYYSIEQDNANPRLIRSTYHSIPKNQKIQKKIQIPFYVVAQPFAKLHQLEKPIPLLNFGEIDPIRCSRCGGFINAFAKFLKSGHVWVCPLCTMKNKTPSEYYCSLTTNGKRRDHEQRPELNRGSVDYLINEKDQVETNEKKSKTKNGYSNNQDLQKQRITDYSKFYTFVIDCSTTSVVSKVFETIIENLIVLVGQMPENSYVSFITFEKKVSIYLPNNPNESEENENENEKEKEKEFDEEKQENIENVCKIFQMTDLNDPFNPISTNWIQPLSKCKKSVVTFLNLLKEKYSTKEKEKENEKDKIKKKPIKRALGAAIEVAYQITQRQGHVLLFNTGLCNLGIGRLTNRVDSRKFGTEEEISLLQPQKSPFWENISDKFRKNNISLHCFLFKFEYSDLITTFYQLCTSTCGEFHYFPTFESVKDKIRLDNEITRFFQRKRVSGPVVMRLRCPIGINVKRALLPEQLIGSDGKEEIVLPSMDSDKSFGFELEIYDNIGGRKSKSPVCIQLAVLHNDPDSKTKRIRVITLGLTPETDISTIYTKLDQEALINYYTRKSILQLQTINSSKIRDQLFDEIYNILHLFRVNKYEDSLLRNTKLNIPTALRLFPQYILGLMKSKLLRNRPAVNIDEKVFLMHYLQYCSVRCCSKFIYPRFLSLNNTIKGLDLQSKFYQSDNEQLMKITSFAIGNAIALSSEHLGFSEITLLDNGLDIYLWFGDNIKLEFLQLLFKQIINSETALNYLTIDNTENQLAQFLINLIHNLRESNPNFQNFLLIKRQDKSEKEFLAHLIQDRNGGKSFNEFLIQIHRKIESKF
ncbi:sec24-related protein [Anaeramoeba flamelloides]|uniref:Sec24-related protein n=1 Tax=Anaeramoeba flamelloides TaxID=1746091 RepID=A0AAV8A8Z2_9EUKA|nr:sec24-related protein [Anaeramoeba flamelloides]